ncbi:hypothetical protein NKG05_11465 [Oerskovia sp. M15]
MRREDLEAAHAATLAALRDGVDVVYQGSFFDGRFHGRADFLIRTDSPAAHLSRTVLARRRSPPGQSRLGRPGLRGVRRQARAPREGPGAAPARGLRGPAPRGGVATSPSLHLILGTRAVTEHRLGDVLPVFRERREELLRLLDSHRAAASPPAGTRRACASAGRAPTAPSRSRSTTTSCGSRACAARSASSSVRAASRP